MRAPNNPLVVSQEPEEEVKWHKYCREIIDGCEEAGPVDQKVEMESEESLFEKSFFINFCTIENIFEIFLSLPLRYSLFHAF